jgi:hypothetical protein
MKKNYFFKAIVIFLALGFCVSCVSPGKYKVTLKDLNKSLKNELSAKKELVELQAQYLTLIQSANDHLKKLKACRQKQSGIITSAADFPTAEEVALVNKALLPLVRGILPGKVRIQSNFNFKKKPGGDSRNSLVGEFLVVFHQDPQRSFRVEVSGDGSIQNCKIFTEEGGFLLDLFPVRKNADPEWKIQFDPVNGGRDFLALPGAIEMLDSFYDLFLSEKRKLKVKLHL